MLQYELRAAEQIAVERRDAATLKVTQQETIDQVNVATPIEGNATKYYRMDTFCNNT